MGCASSKATKGISMPTHPQELPDNFHIVALTSSTYGILKLDPPKAPEEDSKDGMGPHSVKDVLSKLNNLDNKAEAAPQSWLEVSSMLENLKPDLDKPPIAKPGKAPANKPQQPDAIDIHDIMMDLDEDTGLVRPKARQLAHLKKSGKSLPIRTLEELDKRHGAKLSSLKNGPLSQMSIADVRASLKPVGAPKASTAGSEKTASASMLPKNEQKPCLVVEARNRGIKMGSDLIDDDFLQSYKTAFSTISEDEWKVVEALREDAGLESHDKSGDENQANENEMCSNMECKEECVEALSSSFDSEEVSFRTEDEEDLVLELEGSLLMSAQSESLMGKESDVSVKSLLEDYEELCPPGGNQAVVLYTTSLRGIRKTYEDCIKAQETLKSYGVLIDERDVSMHLEYRNELRQLMQRLVTVPRLFVKGRYIGGAEVIAKLAEDGQLGWLLEGATRAHCGAEGAACDGCAGAKFVHCLGCSGSCKIVNDKRQVGRCLECNENGLIQCPICS
ncbi:hypothetical protein L7F22_014015 [Adiantum nelumboides]|nr:hypothetical protein [Adiantum nelumboides]